MLRGERLVYLDSEAGCIAGMHVSGLEAIVVGEDFVGERAVVHVLLDAEVVDCEAEVECGCHCDW